MDRMNQRARQRLTELMRGTERSGDIRDWPADEAWLFEHGYSTDDNPSGWETEAERDMQVRELIYEKAVDAFMEPIAERDTNGEDSRLVGEVLLRVSLSEETSRGNIEELDETFVAVRAVRVLTVWTANDDHKEDLDDLDPDNLMVDAIRSVIGS